MNDKQFTCLVRDIRTNELRNKLIEYVTIGGENYIVRGNNRFMAARQFSFFEQLQYQRVSTPVPGTNFYTDADVIQAASEVRLPRYYGSN